MIVVRSEHGYDAMFWALAMIRSHRQEAWTAAAREDAGMFARGVFAAEWWYRIYRIRRARTRTERR